MPSPHPQQGLLPSFLDRLIDPASAGTASRPGYSIAQILDVVRRDLEDLLNTRQTVTDLAPSLRRLRASIYCYGLPDLISMNALTPQQREEIAGILETTVSHFEPRLRDVRAHLVNVEGEKRPTIHFRIEARLAVEPSPEVAFQTTLELRTGQHLVKPSLT